MTREAWERTITDNAGNVLTGVQIAVFQADGITPATIYGQQSGGAALANPFNTGVQTSAKFYADAGRYVIRAVKDGNTKEFTDVSIADKAVRDDIGSAAYLTATTSPNDATAGRALRVGDFGVGFNAVQVAPTGLDTLNANGFYSVVGSSQAPTTDPYEIQHIQFDASSAKQMAYEAGSTLTRAFIRVKAGGVWRPWREIYHTGSAIGTVAFSGGANSGAIIERGANANGEYVKFADGTMICSFIRAAALGLSSYQGMPFKAGEFFWQFPAAFASEPILAGSGADQNSVGWVSGYATSLAQSTVVYFTPSAVGTSVGVRVMAIGRWR